MNSRELRSSSTRRLAATRHDKPEFVSNVSHEDRQLDQRVPSAPTCQPPPSSPAESVNRKCHFSPASRPALPASQLSTFCFAARCAPCDDGTSYIRSTDTPDGPVPPLVEFSGTTHPRAQQAVDSTRTRRAQSRRLTPSRPASMALTLKPRRNTSARRLTRTRPVLCRNLPQSNSEATTRYEHGEPGYLTLRQLVRNHERFIAAQLADPRVYLFRLRLRRA
jgi:hypothetical protein